MRFFIACLGALLVACGGQQGTSLALTLSLNDGGVTIVGRHDSGEAVRAAWSAASRNQGAMPADPPSGATSEFVPANASLSPLSEFHWRWVPPSCPSSPAPTGLFTDSLITVPYEAVLPMIEGLATVELRYGDLGALSPLLPPQGEVDYQELRGQALVLGAFSEQVSEFGDRWVVRWIGQPPDPASADLESIRLRLAEVDHVLGLVGAELDCLEAVYSESLDPYYTSVFQSPGAPLPLGPEGHPEYELQILLEASFWRGVQEADPRIRPEEHWIVNGLAVLLSECRAAEYARAGLRGSTEEQQVRDRIAYYMARMPLGYPLLAGPSDLSQKRGWARAICPLILSLCLAECSGSQEPGVSSSSAQNLSASRLGRELIERLCLEVVGRRPRELIDAVGRIARSRVEGRNLLSFRSEDDSSSQERIAYEELLQEVQEPDSDSLVFAITEGTMGYLESCGCAVNSDGGMVRRNRELKQLRESLQDRLITIDLGRFYAASSGPSPEGYEDAKRRLVLDLFEVGGYDAVIPDLFDLTYHMECSAPHDLSTKFLASTAAWGSQRAEIMAGGRTVTVVPVTGGSWSDFDYDNAMTAWVKRRVEVVEPIQHLRQQLGSIEDLDARIVVVAGQVSPPLAEEILQRFPAVDLVLSSDPVTLELPPGEDLASPTAQVVSARGSLSVGGRVALFFDTNSYGLSLVSVEAELGRVPRTRTAERYLPNSGQVDEESRQLVTEFYERVDLDWSVEPILEGAFEHDGNTFVGSEACLPCHQDAYSAWTRSKHSLAFNTLQKSQREFVPECVVCHVVGLGERTGWSRGSSGVGPGRHLSGVGCESCHGMGGSHVSGPTTENITRHFGDSCSRCHDAKHSPEFQKSKGRYMNAIKHW